MPQAFSINPIGSPFIELQSVDSTNNYARGLIHAADLPDRQDLARHGMAIFSHEQTAGKGQRGRVWTSEKGMNIALSILINPEPLLPGQQFRLSACTAVALHDFFMKYTADGVTIKWPNDLYWQDRKAGGILIESVIRRRKQELSTWDWAIIGIGININQTVFPDNLPNPVSLKQITGKNFEPVELAKELCQTLQFYFHELMTAGFENIYEKYNQCLYKAGKKVRLKKGSRSFEVMIKAVSREGKLVTAHPGGENPLLTDFDFGEAEWLI